MTTTPTAFRPVWALLCALLCALLAFQLLLDLMNRALVIQCGEWYARTSTVLVLFPLTALGAIATLKFPARAFHRMLSWILIGLFGFIDLVSVTNTLSDAIFGGKVDVGALSNLGILKRCAFVGIGACWIPALCVGYLMWWYVKGVVDEYRGAKGRNGSSSNVSWESVLLWTSLQCACIGLMLWDVPMHTLRVPYPDCMVPLMGTLVSSGGLLLELQTQRQMRLLGSLVIGVGISYAFNAYLSCGYCGYVVNNDLEKGGVSSRATTVWKCPLRSGGLLQVVDVDVHFNTSMNPSPEAYRLRAVRLGHAIMGGQWTAPAAVAGLPIFSAFHLQAAAGVVFSDGQAMESGSRNNLNSGRDVHDQRQKKRSLHVGLGVGGSVTLLQKLGYACDCVELHPQMVQVAKDFFHLEGAACQIGDANQLITQNVLPLDGYDVIIVDIFSGDAGAVSRSGSSEFFAAISRSSMIAERGNRNLYDQVLVVNYFGIQGHQLHALYKSIRQSFSAVNVYRDERFDDQDRASISNFILVASNGAPGLLQTASTNDGRPSSLLTTKPYSTVFAEYKDQLIEVLDQRDVTASMKPTCGDVSSLVELLRHRWCQFEESLEFAGAHWRAMRSQFF